MKISKSVVWQLQGTKMIWGIKHTQHFYVRDAAVILVECTSNKWEFVFEQTLEGFF